MSDTFIRTLSYQYLAAGPGEGPHIFLCLWKHQNIFDASSSLFLLVDVGLQHLRWCNTNEIKNCARVLSATALL